MPFLNNACSFIFMNKLPEAEEHAGLSVFLNSLSPNFTLKFIQSLMTFKHPGSYLNLFNLNIPS